MLESSPNHVRLHFMSPDGAQVLLPQNHQHRNLRRLPMSHPASILYPHMHLKLHDVWCKAQRLLAPATVCNSLSLLHVVHPQLAGLEGLPSLTCCPLEWLLDAPDFEPSTTVQGFPGAVSVNATYTLTEDSQLQLVMEATATRPTPINLAQHSYFNLNGDASKENVLNHDIYINGSVLRLHCSWQLLHQDARLNTGTHSARCMHPHRCSVGSADCCRLSFASCERAHERQGMLC